MIAYPGFDFAAAPRTGSAYFMQAVAAAGLGNGFKAHVHQPHAVEQSDTLRVSLVRHPCAWLASYYEAIWPGMVGVPRVDVFHVGVSHTFDSFVQAYLKHLPGQIGEMFRSYNADTYMKLEDMPWAAIEFFESLGVPQQMLARVRNIDAQNGSKRLPTWNAKLKQRVIEAEKQMIEEFDY